MAADHPTTSLNYPNHAAASFRNVHLVDAPWDAYIAAPGDDPTLRETTFGGGRGLLSFRVDDGRRDDPRVRDHLDRIALLLLLQAGHVASTPSTWARPSLPTRAVRVGRGGP